MMVRQKKRKEDSDITVFSFGIDKNDPKYQQLFAYLEEIDSGARSYVIRQILNNYVNSQTTAPVFGLIPSTPAPAPVAVAPAPEVQPAPVQEVVQPKETAPVTQPAVSDVPPVKENQSPKENPVAKEDQSHPVNAVVPEEKKVKKPRKDSRLSSLANTFN